jgi:localization factor PodJL
MRSQEARFAHELSTRDVDQAAFRSESLRSIGGLQQGLDTATAAAADNFAAITELSDFAQSLKRIQNDGADKADTLERGLAELRAKLDMASVDALKTFSALSDTRAELEEVSVRQAEDSAHTGGMLKALKEELLSLGAKGADKIASVENSLAELREQSNQRISGLKAALDESNATFDASHTKSLEISGALEERFARWVDKSGSDVFTLAEKVDTVENMLAQERANFADIGRATETRLGGLERGLLDIGGTFTTAQAVASESHGVLRQLLTQLADQSTGELRSLQTRVETIGGTFASHYGETAQATALMKERINVVCQAIEDTEARQKALSNLLVASQEREVIATNAISALEEKLKLLDSRVQVAAAMRTEELARSSDASEPVEQAHIAKGDSDEPAGRTAKDTDAEVKAEASAKSAEKSKDAGEADFDEWEYRDEKPQLVVPPAVQTAEAVAMKSMIISPITWQEEQAKRPEVLTQSECEGGNSPDFATTSVDLPPFFEPQLPQVDTLNTPKEIVADDASENWGSAMDGVKDEPSISQSFISQARLSARNAAERADAERAELGAFRKYLGNSQDEASVARKLRKPAIQFGAAAALLAICFTTAKYVFDNQSVMPRAQAAIHEPSLRPQARKAPAVQTSALAVQALNVERPSSGLFGGAPENQTNKDNNSQSGKERSLGSVAANAGHNLDRISALALAGDANAQLQVGLLYLARDGEVTSGSQAVKWLGLSANQGNAVAQYRLGALYAAGHGVPMDQVRAAQLYEKAASLGNRKAMYNLALAYVRGKGVSKNPTEAVRWFLKAANLGLLDAQFDLAVLYERGTGAPQSLLDAYRWYAIAAKSGDRESQQRVQTLATQLPAGDQAAAQKSADEFKASTVIPEANNPPSML